MTAINNKNPHNVDKGEWLHQTNVRTLMLHKGNNHSQMYLWHNHLRTLWFERLHSEKPTNIYNLMSQNISGLELPRLYDPLGPCEQNGCQICQNVFGSSPSPGSSVPTTLIAEGKFSFLTRCAGSVPAGPRRRSTDRTHDVQDEG